MKVISKYFGPSTLVTAAFIGPGTVTVCTLAGVKHGYGLIWALLFSILATIVLQEMAARIGLITQQGLGTAIRRESAKGLFGWGMFVLVFFAILIGNAAYEAGNIGGAVLGADLLWKDFSFWPLALGVLSFGLLFFGKYKWIEQFLIGLVLLISLSFLLTAFLVKPSLSELIRGFLPTFHLEQDWWTIMALVGTTVVPYNLFLHASLVSKKYRDRSQLKDLRIENAVAILLGGIISIVIVIVAAASRFQTSEINSAADLAIQLEPLLGNGAKYGIAIGLLAAGLSSAITAPLAAALAARELFDWGQDDRDWRFRAVWMLVLFIGVLFSSLGFRPIAVIQFAQVMNGILLPIIAIYLLYLVNRKALMQSAVNSLWQNLLGALVVMVALLISFKTLNSVFQFI